MTSDVVGDDASRAYAHGMHPERRRLYTVFKRAFDIFGAVLLVPAFLAVFTVLVILNPFLNPGPIFYVQRRMGRNCEPFWAIKFRSMRPAVSKVRAADDPLELDRIPWLGHRIRRLRLDELPQILNVLAGDMSLVGPRPDNFDHAATYMETIPEYRQRHSVAPGITGLAQIQVGYVQSIEETRQKVLMDLEYIRRAGIRTDLWIAWRTVRVVASRAGS